ncbi:predicted protein, partial [Nematostella vectensis]
MDNSSSVLTSPQYSLSFRIGTSIFTVFLILGTITGNALVIASFIAYSRIRTATNFFVVSLACTDLGVALFSMPLWLAYILTGTIWAENPVLFRVWTAMDILVGTASIGNLVAISLDRFLCITKPLMYYQYITSVRVNSTIACIWVYSVLMAVASYLLWQYRIFNFISSIVYFWVPLLIIISAYSIVFRVALRQTRQINTSNSQKTRASRYSFVTELKAAKTLAAVVGAFALCWAPFVLINGIYSMCIECPYIKPEIILVVKWLHYGNSLLNPPIYGLLNKDFRVAFKHILCCN